MRTSGEVTPSSSSASRRAAVVRVLAGQQHAARGEVVAARVDVLGVGAPVHEHPAQRVADDDAGRGVRRFSARIRERGADPHGPARVVVQRDDLVHPAIVPHSAGGHNGGACPPIARAA